MSIERDSDTATIVVVGKFNPSIFHPAWFLLQGLISDTDAEAAHVVVLEDNLSQFDLDWLRVRVTPQQFVAATPQESHLGALSDLVAEALQLLRHTPTYMCGLNRDLIYRITPEDEWNQLGWTLVPPKNWPLQRPGMASVTEQGERPDDYNGYVRVTVEPVLDSFRDRVVIKVNDHYSFGAAPDPDNTGRIRDLVMTEWNTSLERSRGIAEQIIQGK